MENYSLAIIEKPKTPDKINPKKQEFPELFMSDTSIYPSYTDLKIAYDVICRLRYQASRREYRRQFLKELRTLELLQLRALDGVQLHRIFVKGTKAAPLRDPFTKDERRRLERILAE